MKNKKVLELPEEAQGSGKFVGLKHVIALTQGAQGKVDCLDAANRFYILFVCCSLLEED